MRISEPSVRKERSSSRLGRIDRFSAILCCASRPKLSRASYVLNEGHLLEISTFKLATTRHELILFRTRDSW